MNSFLLESASPRMFFTNKRKKAAGGVSISSLLLPPSDTEKFASTSGSGISSEQIQGLYLNIRYEDGALYCVTGTSLNLFTMDKILENEWDKAVEKFMRSHEIVCT